MSSLPLACSLGDAALARRQSELRTGVLAEATSVERMAQGYRWRFRHAPDLLARLGVVLDAERHCCRFLSIRIEAEPDGGSVVLDIAGPPGTTDVLESWLPTST